MNSIKSTTMLKLLTIFALIVALTGAAELQPRIFGGQNANDGQFPFVVSLKNKKNLVHFCTGTILTPGWVLTAAHCFTQECFNCEAFDVVVKDPVTTKPKGVYSINLHHGHNQHQQNDLAILEVELLYNAFLPSAWGILPSAWNLLRNSWNPLPNSWGLLPVSGVGNVRIGELNQFNQLIVAGWGRVSADSPLMSDSLKYTALKHEGDRKCRDDEMSFCVKGVTNGGGPCEGDCGGPVIQQRDGGEQVLVGIVSHPLHRCGQEGAERITRIAPYIYWIKSVIGTSSLLLKLEA